MITAWIDLEHVAFPEWVALRQIILRDPLGLVYSESDLAEELHDQHLVGWIDGMLVGGLIVRPWGQAGGVVKIRQVAVKESHQGSGLGKKLMREAMEKQRLAGVREIVLHSRANVIGFYEGLGFFCEGQPFLEVGLPHRRMRLCL
jgi:predicted GNAT family N-acyltransferase